MVYLGCTPKMTRSPDWSISTKIEYVLWTTAFIYNRSLYPIPFFYFIFALPIITPPEEIEFRQNVGKFRRKSKDWLARNHDNVGLGLGYGNMFIRGLLFQWASTIKIQLSVLV